MADSGASMSLASILVLAAVALVLLVGWLFIVFRAANSPVKANPRKHTETYEPETFAQVMGISD